MKVIQARPVVAVGLTATILAVAGALILPWFTDGDQTVLISVFIVSVLAALFWTVARGLPRDTMSWLVLILIAFGPAYLLGAYVAVINKTPPGFIAVI